MEENKPFRCEVDGCTKGFWHKAGLKRHLNSHLKVKKELVWECSECVKTFSQVESLRRHVRTAHDSVMFIYSCTFEGCNMMFQRKDNLDRHAASHSEYTWTCDTCGRSFARRDALTRHKRIHTRKTQKAKNLVVQLDEGPNTEATLDYIIYTDEEEEESVNNIIN
ncbi:zinc finger protein 530-like [Drosophila busckii]|uniref:zinc finger protein 530-like n=1 Tax=Drosophila busckii TaxID=30019 RepID=UPI00083F2D9A|nr:zinc finger protein 530-like [Drosophila busckii]